MANTTDTYGTDVPQTSPSNLHESSLQPERPGVNIAMSDSATPNDPIAEEAMIARFPSVAEAEKAAGELAASGIAREQISVLTDPGQKREFMTRYIRRDSDRHTHSGVSSAFFALGGAFTLGLLGVVVATPFGMMATLIAAVVGGVLGALLGAVLGGIAMRPSDDSSMEVVETLAHEGILLAVRCPNDAPCSMLGNASKILARQNVKAIRLRPHLSLADLHPGDTRSKVD